MQNITRYSNALILKHGNFKNKVEAMQIFEEVIDYYRDNIYWKFDYLELLIEDAFQSEDDEIVEQIEKIMIDITKVPLRNNPKAITGYSHQQILIAKYTFYLKSDPKKALELLYETKERMSTYKLTNLVDTIDMEIKNMEDELTKWDTVSKSLESRIKQSQIREYINKALQMQNIG